MKIREIAGIIESLAPLSYQESYDNSGLLVGHPEDEVKAVLLSLDVTEEVIEEAVRKGCDLVVSHHPIIFKGLKKLNGSNYVERTVLSAIRNGVALYAAHTNLDNVLAGGVNAKFADRLGLRNLSVLLPKTDVLSKFFVYVPPSHLETVCEAIFEAGAGAIGNYSECSFRVNGIGTFKPLDKANPFSGQVGEKETSEEIKLEVLLPNHLSASVIRAAKSAHPYEEMAYEMIALSNPDQMVGSGVVGELPEPLSQEDFLALLKKRFGLQVVRYAKGKSAIRRVAVCGGSGSFLTVQAMRSGVDAYVTADIKYHEFFDAEGKMLLCDIGHYESEISTLEIFYEKIKEKLPNFAVIFCELSTNPIHYYQ